MSKLLDFNAIEEKNDCDLLSFYSPFFAVKAKNAHS